MAVTEDGSGFGKFSKRTERALTAGSHIIYRLRKGQVAVSENDFFLPGSGSASMEDQRALIARYSTDLTHVIPGARLAAFAEFSDFEELAAAFFNRTGRNLFHDPNKQVRTTTPRSPGNPDLIVAGPYIPASQTMRVHYWSPGDANGEIWAAALVIPNHSTAKR